MSKFTDDVATRVSNFVNRLAVPEFSIENLQREEVPLENLQMLTNKDLEEQLSFFGGYKSYLEAQLGWQESERGTIESSYEAQLDRAMYVTEKKYLDKGLKKPNKDSLRGEAIFDNAELNALQKALVERTALCVRIRGLRDSYVSQYATVSRVIAIRATVQDQA